jgi:copper chaperone CopZ
MKRITLSVPDMKCGGCVSAVQSALAALDGVKSVEVSLESKQAVVELAKERPADALIQAVARAGYRATLAG